VVKIFRFLLLSFLIINYSCSSPQNGENKYAIIKYVSSQHYSTNVSEIIITKKDSDWKAELFENDKIIENKLLSPRQIDEFKKFVNELRELKDNSQKVLCPIIDHYIVQLKNEVLIKDDNSCYWFGYKFLRQKLFPNYP
jgi:hypothetical protein